MSTLNGPSRDDVPPEQPLLEASLEDGRSCAVLEEEVYQPQKSSDVDSIFSIDDDIASQATQERPQQVMRAEDYLSDCLAKDQKIQSRCREALLMINRDRLTRNLRRILKVYYVSLRKHAVIELEKMTVDLLRRRLARSRIATRLIDTICPTVGMDVSQIRQTAQIGRHEIENWINENRESLGSTVEVERPEDIEQSDSDNDASSDAGEVDARNVDIALAEHFLLTREPFQKLLVNTQMFLLPADLKPLTRILMTIPSHRISFISRDNQSSVDRFKTALEELSGADWQWWPFPGSRALLKDGFTRLIWRCVNCLSQSGCSIS